MDLHSPFSIRVYRLQSINSDLLLPQSTFTGQYFQMTTFCFGVCIVNQSMGQNQLGCGGADNPPVFENNVREGLDPTIIDPKSMYIKKLRHQCILYFILYNLSRFKCIYITFSLMRELCGLWVRFPQFFLFFSVIYNHELDNVHRVNTEQQLPISGVHSIMMENQPSPTLPLFHLYPMCTLCSILQIPVVVNME